ncbi:hypothetical protein GGR50DRAFT_683939 [Xylaria sp. CBS 124048]|nr:hypothetical protein GGR50DRAFT_683939 [Xylaria sp. CBS 124048]
MTDEAFHSTYLGHTLLYVLEIVLFESIGKGNKTRTPGGGRERGGGRGGRWGGGVWFCEVVVGCFFCFFFLIWGFAFLKQHNTTQQLFSLNGFRRGAPPFVEWTVKSETRFFVSKGGREGGGQKKAQWCVVYVLLGLGEFLLFFLRRM